MTQSRWLSFIEALVNAALGYGVALLSQLILFPLFDIAIPLRSNIALGAWFTLISIARSYVVRRWFSRRIFNFADKLSQRIES